MTLRSAVIERLQVEESPLQLPLQPPKTDPAAGVAVRVTPVPAA